MKYNHPFDPLFAATIPYGKQVLKNMVRRRDRVRLKKIAKATSIDIERLQSFRRDGDLSISELQKLTTILLNGLAEYHANTNTLVSTIKQG